ncbi:MAG: hypothetical protein U5R31_16530 [Acidimicrobiia bacterium]|nr:hypothetical protein [Acidimicrobiia bacterium]
MVWMAHVERRGDRRWRARYRAPDGKERSQTFERKVDAERFLASIEHDKLNGSYVDPMAGQVTFREYAEEWRSVQVHRGGTMASVEQQLRLHVYPKLGDRPLASVRPTEIQALVRSLEGHPRALDDRGRARPGDGRVQRCRTRSTASRRAHA